MEVAIASNYGERLFKLIQDIGGRQTSVSENVCDRGAEPIQGRTKTTVELNTLRGSSADRALRRLVRGPQL